MRPSCHAEPRSHTSSMSCCSASSASGSGARRRAIDRRRWSSVGVSLDSDAGLEHTSVSGDRDVGLVEVRGELASAREQAQELGMDGGRIHEA